MIHDGYARRRRTKYICLSVWFYLVQAIGQFVHHEFSESKRKFFAKGIWSNLMALYSDGIDMSLLQLEGLWISGSYSTFMMSSVINDIHGS